MLRITRQGQLFGLDHSRRVLSQPGTATFETSQSCLQSIQCMTNLEYHTVFFKLTGTWGIAKKLVPHA
eukprot:SAG11_NODE_11785_length_738_cov_1.070423_1_plen_68_part_00